MVNKVASDHARSWHPHLGCVVWAQRECPNETTGVPLWMVVSGKVPRGPLAVLKENWTGQRNVSLSFGQTTADCFEELRKNLEIVTVPGLARHLVPHATNNRQQRHFSRF